MTSSILAIPLSALSPVNAMSAVNINAMNQAVMNQAAAAQNAALAAAFGTNPAAVALPLQLAALAALNSVVHVSNLSEEVRFFIIITQAIYNTWRY